LEDDVLIIYAKKNDENTARDSKQPLWHLRERSSLKEATRRFSLPAGIDTSKISSTFQDGVLEVNIPKLEEKKSSSRKIEIQTKKIN
jgi:HSP20 family protein